MGLLQVSLRFGVWFAAAVFAPVCSGDEGTEPHDITPTAQQVDAIVAEVASHQEHVLAELREHNQSHQTVNSVMRLKVYNDELSVDDGQKLRELMLRGQQILEDINDASDEGLGALGEALGRVTEENAAAVLPLAGGSHIND